MLVTATALIVAAMLPALQQGAASTETASATNPIHRSPLAVTRSDSIRALRLAHRAQGDFESLRRRLLPRARFVGVAGCDDVVGHDCYLKQVSSAPPEEAEQVVWARRRLLAIFDSLGAMVPGDRWILGQRVRYLMEIGRPREADSIAVACAGGATEAATKSWCLALVGYTAQQLGHYHRADAAFSMALDEMPDSDRCKWEDLALLVGRRAAGPYRRVECEPRESMTAAFWRLVQPLYLRNVNDLRTEFLARVTRMYIEQDSRTTMSNRWGSSDRDALLRYGVTLWYTQTEEPRGSMSPPGIAGFRREPSFSFFPDARVLATPEELTPADWAFRSLDRQPTYAPLWATSFQPLTDHQVALFRRGDSAFIVAAFAANEAALSETRQAGAFAAIVDRGGVLPPFGKTIEKAGRSVVSTLVAPWRPMIISLEVLDSTNRSAGRTRFAPKLPVSGARLSLSDLLLYTPRKSAPKSLSEAVPLSLHASRAPSSRQIGIFWETYGVRPQGESFEYALVVEPVDEGLFRRALVKLNVMDPNLGVNLQWREVPTVAGGIASRGMTVDLSRLKSGRYRVRLMLTSGTDLPIVAERSIEIL